MKLKRLTNDSHKLSAFQKSHIELNSWKKNMGVVSFGLIYGTYNSSSGVSVESAKVSKADVDENTSLGSWIVRIFFVGNATNFLKFVR